MDRKAHLRLGNVAASGVMRDSKWWSGRDKVIEMPLFSLPGVTVMLGGEVWVTFINMDECWAGGMFGWVCLLFSLML